MTISTVLLTGALATVLTSCAGGPLGLPGNPNDPYPNTLNWAAPFPWTGNHLDYHPGDRFVGYEGMTAEYLTSIHQGRDKGQDLNFVAGSVPSTGLLTVSVDPVGRYEWQGAARGKDGRCYGIRVSSDPKNPSYGATANYLLPTTAPCTGDSVGVAGTQNVSD